MEWSCELPGQVASAAGLKQSHAVLKLDEALSDKEGANVLLQSYGGYVQHAVALPLQQVIQLLFQENLTQKCSYPTTHLRKGQRFFFLCAVSRADIFLLLFFFGKRLTLLTPT